jgi:CubicO group peptidase (beta-lactamase class C family)
MTRALLVLVLILGQVPAAAARTRAVRHPSPDVPPAAIVAVGHRDRIIYSAAFGVTDKVNATFATPRSVMQIGSVTKQFTAAAILRLAERGALTLDDPIQKYVPELDRSGHRHCGPHQCVSLQDRRQPTGHRTRCTRRPLPKQRE